MYNEATAQYLLHQFQLKTPSLKLSLISGELININLEMLILLDAGTIEKLVIDGKEFTKFSHNKENMTIIIIHTFLKKFNILMKESGQHFMFYLLALATQLTKAHNEVENIHALTNTQEQGELITIVLYVLNLPILMRGAAGMGSFPCITIFDIDMLLTIFYEIHSSSGPASGEITEIIQTRIDATIMQCYGSHEETAAIFHNLANVLGKKIAQHFLTTKTLELPHPFFLPPSLTVGSPLFSIFGPVRRDLKKMLGIHKQPSEGHLPQENPGPVFPPPPSGAQGSS